MMIVYQITSLVKKKKNVVFALAIFTCVMILSQCISGPGSVKVDVRGENYAGSLSCKNCHQSIYNEFIHAAHANTSSASLPDIIKPGLIPGSNVFEFNDSLKVVVEKHKDQYYQTAYQSGIKTSSHPFDLIIGSGRKAQSYLYFDSSRIFQLPLSYFIAQNTWANSPGFPSQIAKFDRSIPSGCLGCHSSFIDVKQSYQGFQLTEHYDRQRIIYGIDCERCHGPAAQHVDYHTDHLGEKGTKFITSIKSLSRTQKTDMCSLCHSGVKDAQQSLFDFKPGDKLSDFYFPDFNLPAAEDVDVHGKQSILMMASKCYRLSDNLTCNSCHNVHVKERDDITIFSQRCISCHQQVKHSFIIKDKGLAAVIKTDCIDCHMPLKPSKAITLLTKQKTAAKPDYMRTHLITVYAAESKRFIDSVK